MIAVNCFFLLIISLGFVKRNHTHVYYICSATSFKCLRNDMNSKKKKKEKKERKQILKPKYRSKNVKVTAFIYCLVPFRG